MNVKEVETRFEVLMIELEYAVSDLRFAQEEHETEAGAKALQNACAQLIAARQALEVAKELVSKGFERASMHLAS